MSTPQHEAIRTGLAVRPNVAVLWEGVPLEELGIFDSLSSVQFTVTVGRTRPSKRYKAGKPKVGGAQLEFTLQDRQTARRLAHLLHVTQRPSISVGFGYEGAEGWWVGGASVGEGVPTDAQGRPTYKKIGCFKMDKTTWKYSSSGISKCTLVGVTDKALGLVEKMRPRVYTDITLRQIFQGIADEHGLYLDIDPALRADHRIAHAMKTNQESDWEFLARMADRLGAASMYLSANPPGLGEVGATSVGTQFHASIDGGPITAVLNTQLTHVTRNVLRVSKLSGFVDLKTQELVRPTVIGFGAFLSLEAKRTCDHLAKDVSIEESGYKNGAVPSSAAATPNDDLVKKFVQAGGTETQGFSVQINVGEQFKTPLNIEDKAEVRRVRRKGDVPGTQVYHQVVSGMPTEVDGGLLTGDQLAAIALNNGFTFDVTIDLSPGVPYLQAPGMVRLIGTDVHDGLYGIEEATTKWDGKNGLTTSLKCKPIDVKETSTKKRNPAEDGPSSFVQAGGDEQSGYSVEIKLNGKSFLEPRESLSPTVKFNNVEPEPVPAKP